ncbi:MAG: hypothetical protein RLZZ502_521, partial [Pseudomonadota bacterium]
MQSALWQSGLATAGPQAAQAKKNHQIAEDCDELGELRAMVLSALQSHAVFFSSTLPAKILPPFFNCYTAQGDHYGAHVDNALRTTAVGSPLGQYVRADVS